MMPKFTLTNMVLIQDHDTGKVLVQNRIQKYPGIAFPGGHVERGESIYDSAVREVKEETGYDICNLVSCGWIYWDEKDGGKYFTYFYKTTDFTGMSIEETDEGKVFWVNPDELSGMKLAPNMNKYLKMFSGQYSECYAKLLDDDQWEVTYR